MAMARQCITKEKEIHGVWPITFITLCFFSFFYGVELGVGGGGAVFAFSGF